jgi:Asp-tRNA(Asn)/Glu-tRNA(Gln) amidotransferase A subunit family amidase
VAGYDVDDPFAIPFVPPRVTTEGLKIGVVDAFPLEPACRAAVDRSVRLLEEAGFAVDRFPDFPIDRAHDCWFFFFVRLGATLIRELVGTREHQAHWTGLELWRMIREEAAPTGADVVVQLGTRDRLRSAFLRHMQSFPVLVAPVASIAAFPHRQRTFRIGGKEIGYVDAMKPLTLANLFGLPSLALPMTIHEGVPAGVQLIGAPYQEELLLELGKKLEEARGPLARAPIES